MGVSKIKTPDFFTRKTLKSAYWAGFIAADGYVSKKTNQIGVSLSSKDHKHLCKFAKELGIKVRTRWRQTSLSPDIRSFSEIAFSSKQMKEELAMIYNVVSNKSFILKPPVNLEAKLLKAYLKGLIDGDGSILLKHKSTAIYLRFKIVGSYAICKFIKNYIESNYNLETNTKINPKKKIFSFEIVGRPARIFLEDLKKLRTPELERKWSRVSKTNRK